MFFISCNIQISESITNSWPTLCIPTNSCVQMLRKWELMHSSYYSAGLLKIEHNGRQKQASPVVLRIPEIEKLENVACLVYSENAI